MGVFHVFKIQQMIPNRATYHILKAHSFVEKKKENNHKILKSKYHD